MICRALIKSMNKYFTSNQNVLFIRRCSQKPKPMYAKPVKRLSEQMESLMLICNDTMIPKDWSLIIEDILEKRGEFNKENIKAVMIKKLTNENNINVANSLVNHLIRSNDLSLGTINSILRLYVHLARQGMIIEEHVMFIRENYKKLKEKYKVFDSSTCENFASALSVIGDTKDALTVFEDIKITSVPTKLTYGLVIASLFNEDKKEEALKMSLDSIKDVRNIHTEAYKAWINYIVRNGGNIAKGMEEINDFIFSNCLGVQEDVAFHIRKVYEEHLKWKVKEAKVSNFGKCYNCKRILDYIPLTNEEFKHLQSSFMNKVLIGKDVFLKTSPEELKKFINFLEETAPYDIVMDALNIFFACNGSPQQKVDFLLATVRYFLDKNMKILFLGREHILKWQKRDLNFLTKYTHCFFTDNISQDDPFFLTAALSSGPNTDIITRDKLRGHRHLLEEEKLMNIFMRWQWQHQWRYRVGARGLPVILKPLPFTPFAQKGITWHLPYEILNAEMEDQFSSPTPLPTRWLCMEPPIKR